MRFCIGQTVHIGDFNGDSRTDLLCRTAAAGEMWMLNACSSGGYVRSGSYSDVGVWCSSTQQRFVGDFDDDCHADLLCHDPNTGEKWLRREPF